MVLVFMCCLCCGFLHQQFAHWNIWVCWVFRGWWMLKFCLDSRNSLQFKSISIIKSIVAQLALSGVSKGDIQRSNPPFPTIEKKSILFILHEVEVEFGQDQVATHGYALYCIWFVFCFFKFQLVLVVWVVFDSLFITWI